MKKSSLFLLISMLMFSAFSTNLTADGTQPPGNGTEAYPYRISTLDHLLWISTNSSSWDKHILQIADIDAYATSTWNGGEGFSRIGFGTNFTGSYDGDWHTISGLYINRPSTSYQGFFGVVGGRIINLGLIDVDITGASQVGGLIGLNVYNGHAPIENCYVTGSVTGDHKVGGLIGENYRDAIYSCYTEGTVTGNISVGGLIGYTTTSNVILPIVNSYSTCDVTGGGYIGGFIGYTFWQITINNCYSRGNVTTTDGNPFAGTFVGGCSHLVNIWNSYATGSVSFIDAPDPTDRGFVGYEDGYTTYINNFWDTETSNQSTGIGATGKTTAEMNTQSTFTDAHWGFTFTWEMDEGINDGYPYLITFPEPEPRIPNAASGFFPDDSSINLPQQVTVAWRYTAKTGYLPTGFRLYKGAVLQSDIPYDTDRIYSYIFSGLAYDEAVSWKVIPYNGEGESTEAVYYNFTVMSEPSNPAEVPTETVGAVEEAFTGSNPDEITLPSITIEGSSVQPTIDLVFGSSVSDFDITYEVQDQPDNPLPNPENCTASFEIELPNSIVTTLSLSYGSAITSNVLLRWAGSSWEDITISVSPLFDVGTVDFNWTSTGRGNETFVVNDGGESPLPVSLSSFTAIYVNGSSLLEWTTQSETNNLGWNIYRSETELENAVQVNGNLINGAGTTTEPTEYEFYDEEELIVNTTYNYWLESISFSGETEHFGPISLTIPEEGENPEPPEIEISNIHNYPNPFYPNTEIRFNLKEPANVKVTIYNIKGQEVNKLFDGYCSEDKLSVTWNGNDNNGEKVSSGIYFYKLIAGNETYIKKIILMD